MEDRYQYVRGKLKDCVLTMMAHRGVPRDRLIIAVMTGLDLLKERDFPEGEIRRSFCHMMSRIHAAAPGPPSLETYLAAFRWLSDDDVRWIVDALHSLAFAMEGWLASRVPARS